MLEVANDDDSQDDEGDDNLDHDEDDSEIHDKEEPVSGKYDTEDLGNYNIIRKTLLPQNIIHIVIYIIYYHIIIIYKCIFIDCIYECIFIY